MYLGPLDFLEIGESQACFDVLIAVSEGLEMRGWTGRRYSAETGLLETEIVAARRELKATVRNVIAGWRAGVRIFERKDCWSRLASVELPQKSTCCCC